MKWINFALLCGAVYSIYQASRIHLGWAIVVACLWFVVFTQTNRPARSRAMHDKAEKASRTQSDLIGTPKK